MYPMNRFHARRNTINLAIVVLLVVLALIREASEVQATDVGGTISSTTTWTLANSPYVVTGNILVTAGVRLTIEPGVVVKFNAGKSLQVDGELIVRGTSDLPITFTANNSKSPGAWGYILFTDSSVDAVFGGADNYQSGSIIQYAIIEYSGGADIADNGALRLNGSSPYVDHTTIQYSKVHGIYVWNGGKPRITSSTIHDSGIAGGNAAATGIYAGTDAVVTANTVFANTGYGIYVGPNSSVTSNRAYNNGAGGIALSHPDLSTVSFTNNVVYSNQGVGIYGGMNTNAVDNVVYGNAGIGIFVRSGVVSRNKVFNNDAHSGAGGWGCWSGGGISVDAGPATVSYNLVSGNYGSKGGGICYHGDNGEVADNLILHNQASTGGGIYADCYYCTSIALIIHRNIVVDNAASTGGGIDRGAGTIESNSILRNTAGDSAAASTSGDQGFNNNTILDNTTTGGASTGGIYVTGSPSFNANNLLRNTGNALYNGNPQGHIALDSSGNWWGTPDDISVQNMIYDWFDDSGLAIVTYQPYLSSYNTLAPISPPIEVTITVSASSASLTWLPNPESDTAGYKVYWDMDPGYPYANSIDVGAATSYTLNGLGSQTYYIAVTAYDTARDGVDDLTDGNESWYSLEVTAKVGRDLTVPDVTGMPQAQAVSTLASAGLATGAITYQASATVPAGSVISQNPAAGAKVAAGSAVNLLISSGPPPGVGDAYEPDDVCAGAKTIGTDGTAQQHTFHQVGDQDWAQFTGSAGNRYVIEALALGADGNTVLSLFAGCGNSTPLASDDYGLSARIVWTAPQNGEYFVKVNNHDADRYGGTTRYDLSVRTQPLSTPVAIIVGGHDDSRRLQSNINFATNQAYQAFLAGGVTPDNIFYLSPDAMPGRDADATAASLRNAITDWAANKLGADTPLYLYLMDHGGTDTFLINGSQDKVSAADLDQWLSALEQATGNQKINVIIDSCRSGSFIDDAQRISKPGRVIITSSAANQNAYASPKGAYFSDAYLTALADSQSLCTSFELASRALRATGLAQTPWLDDNGNGIPNDPQDGVAACGQGLFASFAERPPVIGSVSATRTVAGPQATVQALIQDDVAVAEVWALVYNPSFVEPPPGDTTVALELPRVTLTDSNGDGTYEALLTDLTEPGSYRIVVYAEDEAGSQALPQGVTIRITTGAVWLPLLAR